jgi:signal transduction histidine kinase
MSCETTRRPGTAVPVLSRITRDRQSRDFSRLRCDNASVNLSAARPQMRWVWTVGAGGAILALAGLPFAVITRHVPDAGIGYYALADLFGAVLFSLVGAWLSSRRPQNAVGWLLLVAGVGLSLSFFTTVYAAAALISLSSYHLPLGKLAGGVAQLAFIVPNVVLRTVLLYAFPDGRLGTKTGRAILVTAVVAVAASATAIIAVHDLSFGPLSAPSLAWFANWFFKWGELALDVLTAMCVVDLLRRSRRAQPPLRGALASFSLGATMLLVAFAIPSAVLFVVPDYNAQVWLGPLLVTVAVVMLSAGAVVAVLRYRLWDIEVVLRRSLMFAALTACLVTGYVAMVTAASALFSGDRLASSVAAALVVAGVASPLRSRIQRGINQVMFGDRKDPDAAMVRLGRRVGSVDQADALLPEIASVIAASLRVPYVSVAVPGEGGLELITTWGRNRFGAEVVPLRVGDDEVGQLEVGRREPEVDLADADLRLIDDLARQAALAVVSVRRVHELQLSRQRLVGAREEERRRIRRDLHDGLGPGLAALTLQLDEAAELIGPDPDAASELVRRLRRDVQGLVGDVRRLVYDLRPPALDDLGLVAAVCQHADNLSRGSLSVAVDAEPQRPELPAAVEVALWRIATEAMTNVVRHAEAQHCWVRLRVDTFRAELEVTDDGRGIDGARAGVGLASLKERAAELGGQCTVGSRLNAPGTRVCAALPIVKAI